jgi:glycosyltransferase involved in cell wall biosynthesis
MQARTEGGSPQRPVTSLVFPTYNPGPRIDHTWHEVRKFLEDAPGSWEVLFVCDGCTDGTPERLARLAAGSDAAHVRILSYIPNRGKGYAVRRGLAAAAGQWRLFTDVDLAYGFADVVRLAQTLQAGADVAIGSRLHPDSRLQLPVWLQGYAFRRHLQSQVFSALVRWLLPLTQADTQAGLKGLSARAAQMVLPHLRCNGFEFDCELLTACVRFGLAITEVPVCVRYEDTASTTGIRTILRMVGELWKIRRAWRKAPLPGAEPAWKPGQRRAA